MDVELMPVKEEDFKIIYSWRNDLVVRQAMFSSQEISWNEHLSFWNKRMQNKNCFSFIIYKCKKPVGLVRLDKEGEKYEVGIIVSPQEQGKGVGKEALKRTIIFARENNITKLFARVKTENLSSKKLFQKSGFKEASCVYELEVCSGTH